MACLLAALALGAAGCRNGLASEGARSPKAEQWFQRASHEYRDARIDAANDSVHQALELAPKDEEVKILAARVALARLEYPEVLRLLRGVQTPGAAGLRGRANWYKGDLPAAAEELEALLADPEVVDPWAKSVSKLARQGVGRRPFAVEGFLAAVEMPRTEPGAPRYIVPLKIDGDEALALVSTGNAEVVLDSATRNEPSWVSLTFEGMDPDRPFEVRDVPAMTQDLTAISHQINAPIKALLGANLLRRLHATLDLSGRQFVVRSFVPPPPPVASKIELFYLRGGGMVLGSSFGADDAQTAAFFVDSAMIHPVALDAGGWKKAGVELGSLTLLPQDASQKLRGGAVPSLRFGAFDMPHVRAIFGLPLEKIEKELEIDVDGSFGAGLLADYRLTFADGGRLLWAEQQRGGEAPKPPAAALTPGAQPPVAPVAPLAPTPGTGPVNLLDPQKQP
ncbi:MAG: hypothetical protein HY908_33665 [Myxococcales bacterium]|nr:hypothetical protein [Myxococcales bacterium]